MLFHSHNCSSRRLVSMLANKTVDNVAPPSRWTVDDCWFADKMQTFVSPLLPLDNAWHFVLRWHSPESVRCGKCREKHGSVRLFSWLPGIRGWELKINKTLLNGCCSFCSHTMPSPTESAHQKISPLQAVLMFYFMQACVLKVWTAQCLQGFSV